MESYSSKDIESRLGEEGGKRWEGGRGGEMGGREGEEGGGREVGGSEGRREREREEWKEEK